jgi:hypothetical protein
VNAAFGSQLATSQIEINTNGAFFGTSLGVAYVGSQWQSFMNLIQPNTDAARNLFFCMRWLTILQSPDSGLMRVVETPQQMGIYKFKTTIFCFKTVVAYLPPRSVNVQPVLVYSPYCGDIAVGDYGASFPFRRLGCLHSDSRSSDRRGNGSVLAGDNDHHRPAHVSGGWQQ